MLTYSRKKMNECAELYVGFRIGTENEASRGELKENVKLLKCTRVLDECLLKECYGAKEEAFENPDETDDWFCCKKKE